MASVSGFVMNTKESSSWYTSRIVADVEGSLDDMCLFWLNSCKENKKGKITSRERRHASSQALHCGNIKRKRKSAKKGTIVTPYTLEMGLIGTCEPMTVAAGLVGHPDW